MSVGHVQRAIETAGIPTVGIYISAFSHVPHQMGVSRSLITPNPLGRPLGAPADTKRQRQILEAALDLLNSPEPISQQFPLPYRRAPAVPPTV